MEPVLYVIKANGEKEPFSEEKVRNSILRAGIPTGLENAVVEHIKNKLHDNIKTSEVYSHITEFLSEKEPFAKAKYSLKQAIMSLGPTGYPFEDFIAKMLETQGYIASVRNIMQGKCITHEVDVIAKKGTQKIMVEAKYHNMPGVRTNVHVALYTKARFNDLVERNDLNQAWLITNTKITTDAISYAICMGMKVISWNYPEGEGLRDMIEQSGLTPLTVLTSLTDSDKQKLLENRIILAKDICKDESCLNVLKLPPEKHQQILKEAEFVSKT